MTLIACLLTATSATIVSDSICCLPGGAIVCDTDGVPHEDRKLLVMPGNFVLTLLGSMALRNHAADRARALLSIDEAIMYLGACLRVGAARLGEAAGQDAPPGRGGNTALCIGWSAARGCMALVVFGACDDFEPTIHGTTDPGARTEAPNAGRMRHRASA